MSDSKNANLAPLNDSKRNSEADDLPPKHPDTSPRSGGAASSTANPSSSTANPSSSNNKRSSVLDRALSKQNRQAARRFFSAYAETWVGLSPVWLMGEALTPGTKVGTKFKKGKTNLMGAAEEIRVAVATSSQDIVVIVDSKLRAGKTDTGKTAEVLKAAGENAILVVSSSLEKAQAQLRQVNVEFGPKIRHSVSSNGRDVIVVLDKALKHPVVITGVSKFAQSRGIPHADALLRLGSLALSKILNALPEDNLEGMETVVEEIDAAELERTSSQQDTEDAEKLGKHGDGDAPKVSQDPYEKMKKDTPCVIA